ncbi:hypothetical protein DFH09DRAFT_1092980 [Mycena vulgaris]|nr:hypothetical protein DFH09DRAFT_1092980 [Mycena vulgaris]
MSLSSSDATSKWRHFERGRLAAERMTLEDHYYRYQSLLALISSPSIRDCAGPHPPQHWPEFPMLLFSRVVSGVRTVARHCRVHPVLTWDTIELDGLLWENALSLPKLQNLLKNLLVRSGNDPLVVDVGNNVEAAPGPVFNLLAQPSGRWRTATFLGEISDLHHLSVARGSMDRRESLKIHGWGEDAADAAIALEIFQIPPRLWTLELTGGPEIIKALYKLRVEQLSHLRCIEVIAEGALLALTLTSRLQSSTTLVLGISRMGQLQRLDISFYVPPVTYPISTLVLQIFRSFSPVSARQAAGKVLDGFTLPSLATLGFAVVHMDDDNPPFHLPWPHSEFLALSERSLFHAHLHTVDLQQVVITAGELLQSLSALPGLEELLISDQPDDLGGASAGS